MTWTQAFVAAAVFLGILLPAIWYNQTQIPTVYKAWPSEECIRVQGQGREGCDSIPRKHKTIWIEQGAHNGAF